MSILNASKTYRRNGHPSLNVPVVMPLVKVSIDTDGFLDVTLDREPYSADGALQRSDLAGVLAGITADLGTPVRVQISEPDGSCFTDIVTPDNEPDQPSEPPRFSKVPAELVGDGFLPGEDVAIAVVIAHQVAGRNGSAQLRLPPSLLEAHHDAVVLFGRQSGTVVLGGLS